MKSKFLKKYFAIVLILFTLFACVFSFVSCDSNNYTLVNIQEKYSNMVSEYNSNFNNYTININFSSDFTTAMEKENPDTDAEKRFVTFSYYNDLFTGIFSYYENYYSGFYSDSKAFEQSELNTVYNKLLNLETYLKEFIKEKEELEDELSALGFENPPVLSITTFTYKYNMLVEKSLDFMDSFIEYHKSRVFGDENSDIYAVRRNVAEAKYDIAKLCYYENFKSLNNLSGVNGSCDLSSLVTCVKNASFDNSEYHILLDLVTEINSISSSSLTYDENNYQNLKHYKASYDQNYKIYEKIYSEFDMFNLEQNRLQAFEGANLDAFCSRFVNTEKINYEFMINLKTKFMKSYFDAVKNFVTV